MSVTQINFGKNNRPMIKIYTDGSCLVNPGGPGGWAFVVADYNDITITDTTLFFCGAKHETTNNAMELTAILEALRWADDAGRSNFIIYSDSKYCMNTCNTWMHLWAKNSWKNKENKKIANEDVVKHIYDLANKITFKIVWVPGHSGNVFNEFVDSLANKMAFRTQGNDFATYSNVGAGDKVNVGSSLYRVIAKFISTGTIVLHPVFNKKLKPLIHDEAEFNSKQYIKI